MLLSLLWRYVTRITPFISCALLALLLIFSFAVEPLGEEEEGENHGHITPWQILLSAQFLWLHILSTLFPLRAFRALGDVISKIQETGNTDLDEKHSVERGDNVVFAIIIPAYKEDPETLRRTLNVLACHPQARSSYHIYLALEEREEEAVAKATYLIAALRHCFLDLCYTLHPSGLPNEAPGKSSNESWAARQVCKDYANIKDNKEVVVTIMDADTHLSARYFCQVSRAYSTASAEIRTSTIYMPPVVFDRNLHQVPLPIRTADVMWACAGISSMYDGSQVSIPTSVYSLSLDFVESVGGWDTDHGAIGEDMHMYLKCFFALSGHLNVKVIYAAASQCNVSSGSAGIKGYMSCLLARYHQAVRHMWGTLDTGYAVRQAGALLVQSLSSSWAQKSGLLTDHAPNGTTNHSDAKSCNPTSNIKPSRGIHVTNVLTVFLRLFEAHILPIQLAVVLIGSDAYSLRYPSFLIPLPLRIALDLCSVCRAVGFTTMLAVFYRYEQYHRLCLGLRKEDMRKGGLLDEMTEDDFSPNVFQSFGILEAALFPLGGFVFGAFPAIQAIFTHVFTERLTYKVTLKPQLVCCGEALDDAALSATSSPVRVSLDVESRSSSEYSDAV